MATSKKKVRVVWREYHNPPVYEFINSHEEQHDREIVGKTMDFLMETFPEIAPT